MSKCGSLEPKTQKKKGNLDNTQLLKSFSQQRQIQQSEEKAYGLGEFIYKSCL